MFNSPTRPGFSKFPRPLSNRYKEKMSAPNNAYYVLTVAHAGLPNSVLFNVVGDARYLRLDGSNANSNIDIGAYYLTADGSVLTWLSSDTGTDLSINASADDNVYLFENAADGETPVFRIYGRPTGQALGYLQIQALTAGPTTGISITSSYDEIDFGNSNFYTAGNFDVGGYVGAGNLTLASGSITDSSGAISFGNENLSTTGTLYIDVIEKNATGGVSFNDPMFMAGGYFYHSLADADTGIIFSTDGFFFVGGGENKVYIKPTDAKSPQGIIFNYGNVDFDIQFKGATNDNALYLDAGNENITINSAPISANYDLMLAGDGVLGLKETATPTADTNYGKVYTKNDNKLYFQDGAGAEHEIAFV